MRLRWPWLLGGAAVLLWARSAEASVRGGGAARVPEDEKARWLASVWVAVTAASGAPWQVKVYITAQAALESGWGSGKAARTGNNLFNITSVPGDGRAVVEGPDKECDALGNCKSITQRFRAYPSYLASVADYLDFLGGPRYATAKQLLFAGDFGFVAALRAGGYFTLPLADYEKQMRGVIAGVQKRLATLGIVPGAAPPFVA